MNREMFLNKEIINKSNQRGVVTYFDETHLKVKYEKEEKTYSSLVAFKNKFLSFLDDSLNALIEEELSIKEQEESKNEAEKIKNQSDIALRNKKAAEEYKRLSSKNSILQSLFGNDFIYPPYLKSVKQYKHLLVDLWGDLLVAVPKNSVHNPVQN
ncbi:MAG: hypothetical protein SPL00_04310 [Bacilli bacterium]|nr:hypothetical protein [Bacilli bacterium]